MPKKKVAVSLRTPAPAPEGAAAGIDVVAGSSLQSEAATIEAFVSGAAAALEQAASERPSELRELLRRGPDGLRELTLYLPEQLARDLAAHCQAHDLDPSRLIARALEQYLSGGAASGEFGLRKTARAMLVEIARRAREYWIARRGAAGAAQPAAS